MNFAELKSQYLAAQLQGDRRQAVRLVVDGLEHGGITPADMTEHVIRSAQREIGRLWQENTIGIAEEHMATAISQLALAQIFARADHAAPNGRKVFVACVEGELHELPARLVADALDTAGFDTRFLGADVPTDHLLHMIADDRPDLLALSATMSFHAGALRDAIARVRALPGPRIPIAVGGNACIWSPNLANEADFTANSGAELIEAAKRLLKVDVAA